MQTVPVRERVEGQFIIDTADYHWVVRRSPLLTKQFSEDQIWLMVSQIHLEEISAEEIAENELRDENEKKVVHIGKFTLGQRPEIYQVPFPKGYDALTYTEQEMLAAMYLRQKAFQ